MQGYEVSSQPCIIRYPSSRNTHTWEGSSWVKAFAGKLGQLKRDKFSEFVPESLRRGQMYLLGTFFDFWQCFLLKSARFSHNRFTRHGAHVGINTETASLIFFPYLTEYPVATTLPNRV